MKIKEKLKDILSVIFISAFLSLYISINVFALGDSLSLPLPDAYRGSYSQAISQYPNAPKNGSGVEYNGFKVQSTNTVWAKPNDVLGITAWSKMRGTSAPNTIAHSYLGLTGTDLPTSWWLIQDGIPLGEQMPIVDSYSSDVTPVDGKTGRTSLSDGVTHYGALFWVKFSSNTAGRSYGIHSNAYSYNGNWMTSQIPYSGWQVSNETINIDGTPPDINISPESANVYSSKSIYIKLTATDLGSGMQYYSYTIFKNGVAVQNSGNIYAAEHSNIAAGSQFVQPTSSLYNPVGGQFTSNYDTEANSIITSTSILSGEVVLNEPGIYKVKVTSVDNLGNTFTKTSNIYQIINSINNDNLNVVQYDYKQDDNNYWVRPNSTIGVYTDGYLPDIYGVYPSRTYLALARDGMLNSNTSRQYADINNHYHTGSEYLSDFNFLNNGNKATQSSANGNNYLSTIHHLTAKNDGTKYKLYYSNSFIDNTGTEYIQNYSDSGKWLHADGIAPGFDDVSNSVVDTKVSTIINIDSKLNISGNVYNLSDIGSGVNSVYAKVYPTGEESQTKILPLALNNGEWSLSSTDGYSLFKSADINVDIYTKDNVGNIGKIKSERFNLLTVTAQIVPYGQQNFTGIPILEKGQKAILKIYTTGYPDTLNITFPASLSTLDSSLNKTININPQANLETDVVFNVPRSIQDSQYTVIVKAINSSSGVTKETDPQFNVNSDIFNGLRTTILDDN